MWLQSLVLIATNGLLILGQDVGDECVANNEERSGICTLLSNCAEAIRSIRNKQFNKFQRCGFSGDQEVVCCPQTGNKFGSGVTTKQKAGAIADRECKKFAESRLEPLDLHIIGGEMASLGEFPHMVAIGFDRGSGYQFDCGGSLIAHNYVLTAAHCIDTLERIAPSMVRVGVVAVGSNQWDDATDVGIEDIKTHPQYTRREKYHDLALIRLNKSVEFSSNLHAACLYTGEADPVIPLTITGWGQTNVATEHHSQMLLKANVTVVPRNQCDQSYGGWRKLPQGISDDQICAGDPDGLKDTCQGDSGGPLQGVTSQDGQYRVVGVTSFGRGCGSPVPGVYTRVQRYVAWIEGIVWPQQ